MRSSAFTVLSLAVIRVRIAFERQCQNRDVVALCDCADKLPDRQDDVFNKLLGGIAFFHFQRPDQPVIGVEFVLMIHGFGDPVRIKDQAGAGLQGGHLGFVAGIFQNPEHDLRRDTQPFGLCALLK